VTSDLSCVSSCGRCQTVAKAVFALSRPEGVAGIGWIFGYMIDGTKPNWFASRSPRTRLQNAGESVGLEGILLSDILPTGFEIGVKYGDVNPGDVVALSVGSGWTGGGHDRSSLWSIEGHRDRPRRQSSEARIDFGATDTVNSGDADWKEQSWPH